MCRVEATPKFHRTRVRHGCRRSSEAVRGTRPKSGPKWGNSGFYHFDRDEGWPSQVGGIVALGGVSIHIVYLENWGRVLIPCRFVTDSPYAAHTSIIVWYAVHWEKYCFENYNIPAYRICLMQLGMQHWEIYWKGFYFKPKSIIDYSNKHVNKLVVFIVVFISIISKYKGIRIIIFKTDKCKSKILKLKVRV